MKERVSEEAKASEFMKGPKRGRGCYAVPNEDTRHNQFQLGSNPMAMTAFEKSLVTKEAAEREIARQVYSRGIQGRDGGECARPQYEL